MKKKEKANQTIPLQLDILYERTKKKDDEKVAKI